MPDKVDPFRTDELLRFKRTAVRGAALVAVAVAIIVTYLVWSGRVDTCGAGANWWFGIVTVAPLVFIGLATWSAVLSPNRREMTTWMVAILVAVLVYVPSAFITLIGEGLASASC